MADNEEFSFKVEKDYGSFGDGSWQFHLTKTSWQGRPAKLDVRQWNEDMTRMKRGVTLTDAEAYDLMSLLEDALTE